MIWQSITSFNSCNKIATKVEFRDGQLQVLTAATAEGGTVLWSSETNPNQPTTSDTSAPAHRAHPKYFGYGHNRCVENCVELWSEGLAGAKYLKPFPVGSGYYEGALKNDNDGFGVSQASRAVWQRCVTKCFCCSRECLSVSFVFSVLLLSVMLQPPASTRSDVFLFVSPYVRTAGPTSCSLPPPFIPCATPIKVGGKRVLRQNLVAEDAESGQLRIHRLAPKEGRR